MIETTFPESEGFGLEVLAKEYIDKAENRGRQEGRQEEQQKTLARLLRRKLGIPKLPVKLEAKFAELSTEDLDQLIEDLFDFNTVADLRQWLADRA